MNGLKLFYLLFVLMDDQGIATNEAVHLAKFHDHQECINYSIEQYDANPNWAIEIFCLELPALNDLVTK